MSDVELLRKIVEFEEQHIDEWRAKEKQFKEEYGEDIKYGWSWSDVGIHPSKLQKLLLDGWIEVTYKSRSRTEYRLVDFERAKQYVGGYTSIREFKPIRRKIEFDQLFTRIVGYDDLKEALRIIIKVDKPLGVIMYGPPASGKSLFLEDLFHYYGEMAEFMTGYELSKAGLAKLVQERNPSVIIIDEVDKIEAGKETLSPLLQIMEGGYVRRVKGDYITEAERKEVKVFMAGNRISKIPDEIISRCKPFVFYLPEYTYEQFKQICLNYLPEESGVSRETALWIAEEVWKLDRDVRAARNIARVCGDDREKIRFMLELVRKYKG